MGSVLRYLVSGWIQGASKFPELPLGTFIVNIFGCLVIGFASVLVEQFGFLDPRLRLLFFIGFLGGFTTFSSFSNEAFSLLQGGSFAWAFLDLMAHLFFGLLAVWAGRSLAYWIWR